MEIRKVNRSVIREGGQGWQWWESGRIGEHFRKTLTVFKKAWRNVKT